MSYPETPNDGFELLPVQLADWRVVVFQEVEWVGSALDDV